MVERINNSGGKAKLTIVEDCAHPVWEKAFTSHNTYYWLLNNIRNDSEDK